MANKKKYTMLDFHGFEDMIKKIEKAGGSVDQVAKDLTYMAFNIINPELKAFMSQHKQTGATEKSLVPANIEAYRGRFTTKIGFSISKGGLPALFLDIGTPKQQPHFFISKAFSKNHKKIREEQEKALQKILSEIGG